MSEERPSAAEALYGPNGPISDGPGLGRQREVIESGFARPDPRFADERQPSPSQPAARPGPAFDAARYTVPAGTQLDLGVVTRKDERPDAQSSAISDARWLRL